METNAGAGLYLQELHEQAGGCRIQQIEFPREIISISGTIVISESGGDNHINTRIRRDDNCRAINPGECNQETWKREEICI